MLPTSMLLGELSSRRTTKPIDKDGQDGTGQNARVVKNLTEKRHGGDNKIHYRCKKYTKVNMGKPKNVEVILGIPPRK